MTTKSTLVLTVLIAITLNSLQQAAAQANTKLSNLAAPTAINQNLLPNNNNMRDLGTAAKSWRVLYLDSAIYLKDAIFMHSAGTYNAFVGFQAGKSITSGISNAALGYNALTANTTGSQNTALGWSALTANTSGSNNTALGKAVLYTNTDGNFNSGSGYQALFYNWHGNQNTASGAYSLFHNIDGSDNTAMGFNAMPVNQSGGLNSAFGEYALNSNSTGIGNTGAGSSALYRNATGSNNTALGYAAYFTADNLSNTTCIGYFSGGVVNASNRIEVGNTSVTWIGGEVGWSTYSDGRVKENVKQNVPGLQFINKLRPVSYNYNIHKQNEMLYKGKKGAADWSSKYDIEKQRFTGFIAQDVEKAASDLKYEFSGVVKPTSDNDLYSLRYSDFVVPLVKAVQELSNQNDSLKQNNQALNDKMDALSAKISQMEAAMSQCCNSFSANMQSSNNKSSQTITSAAARLDQNVPNPFSSSTSIQYNIPAHFKSAQLVIADANGVVVKQLQLNTAGKGTVNINGYNLSSGTYTYSLLIDGTTVETKKMIVGK